MATALSTMTVSDRRLADALSPRHRKAIAIQKTRTTKNGPETETCDALMVELKHVARHTVWLGPPNLGLAPLFPLPYAWLMSSRSRAATIVFAASAAKHGVSYIDFSAPEHAERMRHGKKLHFATDGFHPSSSSYGYGYDAARAAMFAPTES